MRGMQPKTSICNIATLNVCESCPYRSMLEQVEFKKTYKLRSTEDAFVALEDNTVTLSTMKASKFFVVFEHDITKWERTLALVSETIEMIQQVQRNWQYLESIFVGSEDIRKQLPQACVFLSCAMNQRCDSELNQRPCQEVWQFCATSSGTLNPSTILGTCTAYSCQQWSAHCGNGP